MRTPISSNTAYIGRFAPSPTGPLHMGSLLTALASYLEAKKNSGYWLVRIEDIDPPREQPGADSQILKALEQHGLEWDGAVLYQSARLEAYRACIERLLTENLAYYCACSRQDLKHCAVYPGTCRRLSHKSFENLAIRLKIKNRVIRFQDGIQGAQKEQLATDIGDFVIRRKEGLVAYQLAVAMDDSYQQITHVVRGSDLLSSTSRQIFIMQTLQSPIPHYCHLPVLENKQGQKLSKQNLAKPIQSEKAGFNLWQALALLQQQPPMELQGASVALVLNWALAHWRLEKVPHRMGIHYQNADISVGDPR